MKGTREFTFTEKNTHEGKPNEDCFAVSSGGCYVVADGATRSRKKNGEYPELSARLAADAFCESALSAYHSDNSIPSAFYRANCAIKEVNRENRITYETTDYLQNDFLACVGALGMLTGKFPYELHYGFIGDCGILVYDKELMPIVLSENQLGIMEQFRDQWGFGENLDAQKLFWRKEMRNKAIRRMTYGSLTGEETALCYVRTGSLKLELGDTVLFFSDGILPFIYDRWFRKILRHDFREKHGEKFIGILTRFIARLGQRPGASGIANLDDDKTLIAVSILENSDV